MSDYKSLSDYELLKEISNFNSRALEELYIRYSTLFYTLIKKISGDEKTAESILVEVFAIIWRKAEKFDPTIGNAYVWLVNLARNRAIDTVRRNRASDSNELEVYNDKYEDFFIIPQLDPNIDDLDLRTAASLQPKIQAALEKLSDAQKYVIHLAYYEGYTLNEIADQLNIPIETVRNKVMIALHNLKDYLIGEQNNG